MNIHLPAILMFTRGTRFWHTAMSELDERTVYKLLNQQTHCDRRWYGHVWPISTILELDVVGYSNMFSNVTFPLNESISNESWLLDESDLSRLSLVGRSSHLVIGYHSYSTFTSRITQKLGTLPWSPGLWKPVPIGEEKVRWIRQILYDVPIYYILQIWGSR